MDLVKKKLIGAIDSTIRSFMAVVIPLAGRLHAPHTGSRDLKGLFDPTLF